VVAVNFSGAFFMVRAAISHLLNQGWGRIVGVTTSLDNMYASAVYGPSKAGQEAFVANLATELAGTGVTANILVPGGPVNTAFLPPDTTLDRQAIIQPDVMQAPVVWLASDAANGFNGQRVIAYYWDESLSIEERLARASAPAAWASLGKQSIVPGH
jgi:3-oxoacyl-[acyl-carrier protein] reductase